MEPLKTNPQWTRYRQSDDIHLNWTQLPEWTRLSNVENHAGVVDKRPIGSSDENGGRFHLISFRSI